MLIKSVSALAVLAFATVQASEPMPYKPLMKMSINQMFGLSRRQTDDGYQPTQSECGTGNTCAEACGDGFEACSSRDDTVHCYDTKAKQTCCPDNSDSCDAGFYCSADKAAGDTWCCPDAMDLETCASAFNVTGPLVSETPKPSTTPTPTAISTPSSTPAQNTTTEAPLTTPSSSPSGSLPQTFNTNTTAPAFSASGTPSPTEVSVSGAVVAGPAGLLALVAAVGVATLL